MSTNTPTTTENSILCASILGLSDDVKSTESLLAALKASRASVYQSLMRDVFPDGYTDETLAQHTAKNPAPIPGTSYGLAFRDYGRPSYAAAIAELFAWIGANRTFSVRRITARWEDLLVKHTSASYHPTLKKL